MFTDGSKSQTCRQIQLIVAEKGSGFMLWKDLIDNLSSYSVPDCTFHTLYLSADHRQIAGISFDDAVAAQM